MLIAGDVSHRTRCDPKFPSPGGTTCDTAEHVVPLGLIDPFKLLTGDLRHRLPTCRAFGTVVLLVLHCSYACAQSPLAKHNLLAGIESLPSGPNFAIVSAKLREGKDVDRAYKQLDTLLARPYGDMFWMYGCAGLYYSTRDVLKPEYKDRIRWCWKHFTPYRGDTENHFLMYYGSLLLMSQAWPDLTDSEWFMGKSSKEIYTESKDYLDHWIDETARYGSTEWNSPRYSYYYITPLILLAEYTKDARMKHRFEMMLEYQLADYAQEYLNGNYCGAHSRVSDEGAIDPRNNETAAYGEYFFGDTITHVQPDVAFAALTRFQCPKIIRQIATDRSQPFESFSLKRGRQMIRYMDKWSASDSSHDATFHAPVYKYDYMTKDFCLSSMQGGIVQPIQQQSWSLVFNSDKPHNIITGLNPYVSAEELGMFFPEYPSFMLERIGNVKKGYTNENKWVGGSPYERIYQEKNVLVAMYDLPANAKTHHVDIFLPWGCRPLDSTRLIDSNMDFAAGWTFYKFDSTRIGIYCDTNHHEFKEKDGIRIRMNADHPRYIIYCASAREVNAPDFLRFTHYPVVFDSKRVYTKGDKDKTVNVALERIKLGKWLSQSPFMQSEKGSRVITLRYKDEEGMLDFR